MDIQYCSDLHLEFKDNNYFFLEHMLVPSADILVLAGDILLFKRLKHHQHFLDALSANWRYVYWLPGNHEYYDSDIEQRSGRFKEQIRENVFLVNGISVVHDDVRLIFSTLWTKIAPQNEVSIEANINDFRRILVGKKPMRAYTYNTLHELNLMAIDLELMERKTEKTVIVTHHVPTKLNYPEIYRNSDLNDVFVVELFDFIERSGADYWIYGHHHFNTPAFTIGKTTMVTNQLGYVHHGEGKDFALDRIITV